MRRRKKIIYEGIQFVSGLSLAAVLRVKKVVANYPLALEEHKKVLKGFEVSKVLFIKEQQENQTALELKIAPLKKKLELTRIQLKELEITLIGYRVGFLSSLIKSSSDIVEWRKDRYDKHATDIINRIQALEAEFRPLYSLESELSQIKYISPPKPPAAPSKTFKIIDESKTYSFDVLDFTYEFLEKVIHDKKQERLVKNEKSERLKAKANAYDEKQRDLAKTTRNSIKHQLKVHPYCPYCFNELNVVNAHADHIYPVAHGGLSTSYNMIFVCSSCNMNKGEKTLREFINKNALDENRIHKSLELLNKRF